jgi:REase_DpnII-MboI
MTTNGTCAALTKAGEPCQRKPSLTGYCSTHNPENIAKHEQKRQRLEKEKQTALTQGKTLREILTVMRITCKGKGWRVSAGHFDEKSGRHASLEVSRNFDRGGIQDTVHGKLDVTLRKDGSLRYSLEGTSSYKYGLEDLIAAIQTDLYQAFSIPLREEGAPLTASEEALQKLELLLRRFHRIAHQLTQRHDNQPTLIIQNEYDVQDLLHAQLLALFDDVRAEDPVPIQAGSSSRIDFLLKQEKIMIEVKMTRAGLRDRDVSNQLIIDIERYRAHPDGHTLVCFVYDPNQYLKNPQSLENDLSRKHDHLTVKVIVCSP